MFVSRPVGRLTYGPPQYLRSIAQSAGIMVNYLYEPKDIEHNHEDYAERGTIAAAPAVRKLLKQAASVRAA